MNCDQQPRLPRSGPGPVAGGSMPTGRAAALPATPPSYLWLGLVLLAAWLPALAAVFQFDDYRVIVGDPAARSLTVWADELGTGLRPLLKLSYLLSWTLGDGAPWAFAAFNLLLHALASTLVWRLGERLFALAGVEAGLRAPAALIAALLFALHPLQTEAVSYLSGRSSSLSGLLALATVAAYDRQLRGGARGWAPALWLAALLSKETAVVVPFALLAWDALARPDDPLRQRMARLWPYPLLLIAVLFAMADSRYAGFFATSLETRAPLDNLRQQLPALVWLLRGALLLRAANIDPELPGAGTIDAGLLAAAACLIGLLAVALGLRRWRWPAFCAAWALIFLLPTNSLLARLDLVNDRQLYLPMAALAWTLGWTLAWLARRQPQTGRAVAALLLATLAGLTALRNLDYRSETALWAATLEQSPGKARVLSNHGVALWQSGREAEAASAFRTALALDPAYLPARRNLRRLTGE